MWIGAGVLETLKRNPPPTTFFPTGQTALAEWLIDESIALVAFTTL
jgi:hypothetical protein